MEFPEGCGLVIPGVGTGDFLVFLCGAFTYEACSWGGGEREVVEAGEFICGFSGGGVVGNVVFFLRGLALRGVGVGTCFCLGDGEVFSVGDSSGVGGSGLCRLSCLLVSTTRCGLDGFGFSGGTGRGLPDLVSPAAF